MLPASGIEREVSILGRERVNADGPFETLRRRSGTDPDADAARSLTSGTCRGR